MAGKMTDGSANVVEEALLRALLDNSPTVSWAKDADCRYVYLSGTFEKRFNVSIGDWRGKTDYDVWPRYIADGLRKNDMKVLADGSSVATVEHVRNSDGTTGDWWNIKFPFEDAAGNRYVGGIAVDITGRRRAEDELAEKEETLRKLSDNLPDGLVYQIDSGEDGRSRRFTYIGGSVERMHGVTTAEALKDPQAIYGQVVDSDRAMVMEREAAAVAGMTPLVVEVRVRLPSGELRWRRFTSSPRRLPDRRIVWDGIEIDITERKKAEADLQNYQQNLEAMVEARTRELQEAHDMLERSERLAALGKFAGALSHELRNPIGVILNAVSYLTMAGVRFDGSEAQEMLQVIRRQADMTAMIIGNALDFANPQKLELKNGNVNEDIENALSSVAMPAGIVIKKDLRSRMLIHADHNLVELAFVNIIKNSIQACKRSGTITVRSADEGSRVRVAIEDTGGGIESADMNKIFDPLFSRRPQGIGLGLYIVKGIIDRHKGEIRIDNVPGKGVSVTILLPAGGETQSCSDANT